MVHIDTSEFNNLCDKVMRQTDYERDVAKEKLIEFNLDLTAVIRDYLKPPPKAPEPPKTLNQRIYQEIRTFMDITPQSIQTKPPE